MLALTQEDDDNNDENEADHSELEILLQKWKDDQTNRDKNEDDTRYESKDSLNL